jgi:hypothetical protein
MTTPYRFFDDWGLPQVLFQLALALPIFAVVEYASGDHVLPWGKCSSFSGWREASATAGGRGRKCASKA